MKTQKIIMIFAFALFIIPLITVFASANNCTAIRYNGDSDYRADIVIVGHGFPEDQLWDFEKEVNNIVNFTLAYPYPPYNNYSKMINFWFVNQSADLGCSGATCNNGLATALASQCPYDRIYILINDSVGSYGGGGSILATGSRHWNLKEEIFVHEMGGHTFGRLMDEYNYSGTGSLYYSGANCATLEEANYINNTTPCTKWNNFSGTGCYPGCSYSNLYRPTVGSTMRNTAQRYFNSPSQAQIEKEIDFWSNLTKGQSSANPTMKIGESQTLSVIKVNETENITIRWYVNGIEMSNQNQSSMLFVPSEKKNYTIRANASFLKMSEEYSWNIQVINQAPNITSYSPLNAETDEGSPLEFKITAEDLDNDALTYSWLLDTEEQSNSQNWTYNPGYNDAGNHNVTVIVSDSEFNVQNYWNVIVNDVNQAPVLSNIPDMQVEENHELMFNITATDAENDAIEYSANSTLIISKINDSLAEARWTPSHSNLGDNYFEITASDGTSSDKKTIKITVAQHLNQPPVLNNIPDILSYEGETITISPSASDPENDNLIYSYSGWMTSNSKATGYSDSGIYNVNVTVSDGFLTDSQTVIITILNSYEFRTIIKDILSRDRLSGTASLNGMQKNTDANNVAVFDYVHSNTDYPLQYSSSGYQTDNQFVYFDSRLADCSQGTNCQLSGNYPTNCDWNAEYSDWTCKTVKSGSSSIFIFNPLQNAIRIVEYMKK